MWRFIALALLPLAWLTSGCSRTVEKEAEKQIRSVLPDYIGPAERYSVRVQGDSPGAILRGRVRRVHITGDKVRFTPDLVVDKLTLEFDEVAVDTRAKTLSSIEKATFECRLSEAALDAYVRRQRPDLPGLRVALQNNAVRITAKPNAFQPIENALRVDIPVSLDIPVQVEGRLVAKGDGKLDFAPDRARVTLLPVPGLALDYLARRLNPAIDLSQMRMPVRVTRADVAGSSLIIAGQIPPEDILRLGNPTK